MSSLDQSLREIKLMELYPPQPRKEKVGSEADAHLLYNHLYSFPISN